MVIGLVAWGSVRTVNSPNKNAGTEMEFGVGGGPPTQSPSTGTTTTDDELNLDVLLQEHALNASFHLQDLYDGKNVDDSGARLQENSNKIADYFAYRTGIDRGEFLSMWNGHIREYENYTKALRDNSQQARALARENLNMQAVMMGTELNKVVPNLPSEKVEKLMNGHTDLTLSIIEAHATGDTSGKFARSNQAIIQSVEFADEIAESLQVRKD